MIAHLHRLGRQVLFPQVGNVLFQGGLVVLYREEVVPPFATIRWHTSRWVNCASPVTTRSFKVQPGKKLVDSFQFIPFVRHRLLPQDDTRLMGVGRYQVNSRQLLSVDPTQPLPVYGQGLPSLQPSFPQPLL